jgi:ABC-type transport system substrate-binding protein
VKQREVKQQENTGSSNQFLDLQLYPMSGVEVVDRYTYRIKLHGEYPQFVYWLAMPFFGPIPPEADQFYSQPSMKEKNITLYEREEHYPGLVPCGYWPLHAYREQSQPANGAGA